MGIKRKLVFYLEMYGTSILNKKDIIHFERKNLKVHCMYIFLAFNENMIEILIITEQYIYIYIYKENTSSFI